jgi:hypothetical protein
LTVKTSEDAHAAFERCWDYLVLDCRRILASELHYQAMIYFHLRVHGGVPVTQLGMNVKQRIMNPVTPLFQQRDQRKHVDYRGGYETIPDIVIFDSTIDGDWRRRNQESTLRAMLLAMEVKASERHEGRLHAGEIISDIRKLAAHREEVRYRGSDMMPLMLVIDTAPIKQERMRPDAIERMRTESETCGVSLYYLGVESEFRWRVASPQVAPHARDDGGVQHPLAILPATL